MTRIIHVRKRIAEGFDYRVQQPAARPVADWRADAAAALAEGGMRRVENGETFIKDRAGKILFEVYAFV